MNWPAITALITALTAVGALVFTALSLNSTRDQVAIAEQSQLTDRYAKAVEQLDRAGTDHLQARLGALYSLERLAHDSPRDQPTIIEVISAFVRTTAPRHLTDNRCPAALPTADIQAALSILGRRDIAHDSHTQIDLRRACLSGADLRTANLADANLAFTSLENTALMGADLSRANLYNTNFSHSILTGAVLRNATGEEADFSWCGLEKADLAGASLDQGNLSQTELGSANLTGTQLRAANLDGANLIAANLTHTYLVGAKLTRVYLTGADFTDAEHDATTAVTTAFPDDKPARGQWW